MNKKQRELVTSKEGAREALTRAFRRTCTGSFSALLVLISLSLLAEAQPSAAVNLYNRANKEAAKGDLKTAIETYTRALESNNLARNRSNPTTPFETRSEIRPNDAFTADLYTNCAIARIKIGDFDEALVDLDIAIRTNPGLISAYLARGVALRQVGRLEEALSDLNRVIAAKSDLAEAYNDRADVFLDMGKVSDAMVDLRHVLPMRPRFPGTHYQLGYAELAQRDYGAAISNFNKAMELDPKMSGAYEGRGTALMARGELTKAIEDFTTALKINPNRAEAFENRGLALLLLGRVAEAEEDFAECLRLKPQLQTDLRRRIEMVREPQTRIP